MGFWIIFNLKKSNLIKNENVGELYWKIWDCLGTGHNLSVGGAHQKKISPFIQFLKKPVQKSILPSEILYLHSKKNN